MTNHAPATPLSSDNPMMTSASPASSPQNFWYTQPTWNWPGTAAAQQQQQPPWNYWYHPAAYGFPAPPPGPPAAATTPPEGDSGVVDPAAPGAGWMQGVRAILTEFTGVGGQEQAAEVPANRVAPERAPQPQGQQQQQQQQQQQAIMMGNPMVGGFMGAEEFGEGAENMDIVDRFYMLFRLCLFIGLCFAYSSLDKAIIVFSVAAYVYFYNIYRRHAAMRRAAAAVAVAEAQRTQEQATQPAVTTPSTESNHAAGTPSTEGSNTASGTNDDPDQQVRSRDTSNSSEHSAPQVTSTEPAGIQRLTSTLRLVVSTSYQFLFSLLTSLIPEQPPPIRLD
ncbi:Homocysteine-responsive endoplasmic reticulum-resident ubiquitin domain member 2 protein [Fasciola gigantica]|uniref:Homocysteine-responsive endoplasmic reticulum-resident ubiquitin domain member 2 protein n=1 Tax=Fasciola gigantica TaxID=46835 RepID=A0A504YQP3_FASGI|nr:Homocysteine-responsive endoplasmic reticulum-resident ubiquitin domain member 2 protein [Fasciola gigantica]